MIEMSYKILTRHVNRDSTINTDWEGDGISHLLCQLMGGQMDIDILHKCRLVDIDFPEEVLKYYLKPKYGISGLRKFLDKLINHSVEQLLNQTGMSLKVLLEMIKELIDGGVDFIKEDEILSNPSFCKLKIEYL